MTDTKDIYEIDCIFDRSFEDAGAIEPTWYRIKNLNKSWSEISAPSINFSWNNLAKTPESYLIYRIYLGSGDLIPGNNASLRGHKTEIPLGKRSAQFRIRTVRSDPQGNLRSDHIYSGIIPVMSGLASNNIITVTAAKDHLHELQISFAAIADEFSRSQVTITYNPARLRFREAFTAEQRAIPIGRTRDIAMEIKDASTPGKITFACRLENSRPHRDGLVSNFRFVGLVDGETQINLS
jgi:hypothetical protein